ncbi:electron transfer flavoprotein subunit beta [Larsenimonas rhizosphaerae]|uniref:Electron transfer flavoprotein subunit beta n=1 Tax=Larsenimonas rhizosphaerae TaxID=2944682 RepID=A0AA41ZET1_9GAMM|nr:electron transfer flavoprotein subunit beta [Larsenimonas rhizosphaerae]MCM2129314.1 electron transfer flavoprotein subunit beta [Larsenimonas rhizosphaerae]MCX2523967.1 electron transfer flavoprotein subunit beta [Larsenimonas rhizosphaerae]
MKRHESMASGSSGLSVAVLVSTGRHSLTGRPGRADQDARAVELALNVENSHIRLFHAGEPGEECREALRGYLGMGIDSISLIEQSADADVSAALEEILRESKPGLVLTGTQAEQGEGSGLLPYMLAESLGWSLIAGLVSIESIEGNQATILQALPRGQRRRLKVRLPAIATVDESAARARQSAFGPAQRGRIDTISHDSSTDEALAGLSIKAARVRPKRLKIVKSKSARDRFKAAAAKSEGGAGQVLSEVSAQEGAEAIFKLLQDENVLSI